MWDRTTENPLTLRDTLSSNYIIRNFRTQGNDLFYIHVTWDMGARNNAV